MLAVKVAHVLELKEIRPDIELLRLEIANGKVFPIFYLREIDNVLGSL
jgi:hypothetical protein